MSQAQSGSSRSRFGFNDTRFVPTARRPGSPPSPPPEVASKQKASGRKSFPTRTFVQAQMAGVVNHSAQLMQESARGGHDPKSRGRKLAHSLHHLCCAGRKFILPGNLLVKLDELDEFALAALKAFEAASVDAGLEALRKALVKFEAISHDLNVKIRLLRDAEPSAVPKPSPSAAAWRKPRHTPDAMKRQVHREGQPSTGEARP